MSASHLEILIHLTGMLVSDLTILSCMTLLLIIGIIEVAAVIKVRVAATIEMAVVATIKVAVAATEVYTIPGEAILMIGATEPTPGGGPILEIPPFLNHLGDIPADHDLQLDFAEGVNLTHAVRADQGCLGEGMAITPKVIIAQSLQIANALGMPPDLPERNDSQSSKQSDAVISH